MGEQLTLKHITDANVAKYVYGSDTCICLGEQISLRKHVPVSPAHLFMMLITNADGGGSPVNVIGALNEVCSLSVV